MRSFFFLAALPAATTLAQALLTDLDQISKYWGQITPYKDNPQNYFGVEIPGLPDGCQVEQAHLLQRHAQRFPTGGDDDGENDERFASKIQKYQKSGKGKFTGPLSFLNSYKYLMKENYLTGIGARTEFGAGVHFWNHYGRILYDAKVGQLAYKPTGGPKPVMRTTSESRIYNSEINWALGFYGQSYKPIPDPSLSGVQSEFDLVVITEGGTENNTLASYDSCLNDDKNSIGYIGDSDVFLWIEKYLGAATDRLQKYAGDGFAFNTNDTYAMQSICAYETSFLGFGLSAFCDFFTAEEWEGFEHALEIIYYYDYSYGQPTGRAQGIGYVQELLARIEGHYIKVSDSSVNSTLDDNGKTFPLGLPFYADFSHDDIIVSVLTAMSMEYFHDPPNMSQVPVDPDRRFVLSNMTPFGARLTTEVVGCASADPSPLPADEAYRIQYYKTQYGYDPSNAPHKFIRMRLNYGLLPLDTIAGGACAGRPDGMCPLADFLSSQATAYEKSQYDRACFGKYKVFKPSSGYDYNGAPPPE